MEIIKPQDITPSFGFLHPTHAAGGTIYFTPKQCVQIAKAYAKTKLEAKKYRKVDISANQEPYPDEAYGIYAYNIYDISVAIKSEQGVNKVEVTKRF